MDHELSEPKGEKQKQVWEGRLGGPGKGGENRALLEYWQDLGIVDLDWSYLVVIQASKKGNIGHRNQGQKKGGTRFPKLLQMVGWSSHKSHSFVGLGKVHHSCLFSSVCDKKQQTKMVRDYWMMSVCFIMMQASTPEFRKWVCYKNLEHFMQHAIFLLLQ
jgi:hypothetical protein